MTADGAIAEARRRFLSEIFDEVRATSGWTGCERLAGRVMKAMADVPREKFVGKNDHGRAYLNRPLQIGFVPMVHGLKDRESS